MDALLTDDQIGAVDPGEREWAAQAACETIMDLGHRRLMTKSEQLNRFAAERVRYSRRAAGSDGRSSGDLDAFLKGGNQPEARHQPPLTAAQPRQPADGRRKARRGKARPGKQRTRMRHPRKPAANPSRTTTRSRASRNRASRSSRAGVSEGARARQNWVERAGRAEAERDALAKQLEDARKPATTVHTAAAT